MVGITRIVRNMEGLRMFITAQGRIGRGPASMKQGDCVCIFSYAKTAHIIRPTANAAQTTYAFIGGAYVHSVMNGEIEDIDIKEQDIILV